MPDAHFCAANGRMAKTSVSSNFRSLCDKFVCCCKKAAGNRLPLGFSNEAQRLTRDCITQRQEEIATAAEASSRSCEKPCSKEQRNGWRRSTISNSTTVCGRDPWLLHYMKLSCTIHLIVKHSIEGMLPSNEINATWRNICKKKLAYWIGL